jgi:serine protease AprX
MKKCFTIWILTSIVLFSNPSRAQVVVDEWVDQAITARSISSLLPAIPKTLGLEVIVSFHGSGAPTASQIRILQDVGITNGIAFRSFPMVGVLATPLQISLLRTKSSVRSIFLNRDLQYFNENSTELTGVDRLREDPDITAKNGGMPVTGKGVGVLINDSGVDGTHEDIKFNTHLVQNVLGTTNLASTLGMLPPTYLENVPSTDTNSGHGTHCAGTVGGTGIMSGGKYEGVAPGADLIGYGSGLLISILDALGGLDYAVQKQDEYGIRVVSNSWGSSGSFEPLDPINIATKVLYDNGIATVFAAGNAGPSSGTMNPYSLAPWVISVAAGDRNRELADFSSRGIENDQTTFTMDGEVWVSENRPTLTAPGVDIVSTRAISPLPVLSTTQDVMNLDPAHVPFYTHMSGTSMATPHVAGIVALMLEADETLTPAEIKDILQDTSTPMPGYETWEAGSGYVNAFDAVSYVFEAKTAGAVPATSSSSLLEQTSGYSFASYPNPFTNRLTLHYTLQDDAMVKLVIFDSHGNAATTLVNGYQEKGQHQLQFRRSTLNLHPGLYVAKIQAGKYTESIRLTVAE